MNYLSTLLLHVNGLFSLGNSLHWLEELNEFFFGQGRVLDHFKICFDVFSSLVSNQSC
jgi:hypothetical protein